VWTSQLPLGQAAKAQYTAAPNTPTNTLVQNFELFQAKLKFVNLNDCDPKLRNQVDAKMTSARSDIGKLLNLALESGMIDPKIIGINKIVLAEWVRWKCRYGCPDYGLWLKCPPHSPTPSETRALLSEYRRALLFRIKPESGYTGTHVVGNVYRSLSELERKIFLSGYRKALAFGGGECDLCETCCVESGICRNPTIARPSMEACGIDVFATAKKAGYKLTILNSKDVPFTWIGMVLID
jgi:predicted metal-binding protein